MVIRSALWALVTSIGLVTVAPVAGLAQQAPPRAQFSLENGERVFRFCASCHEIGDGARNAIGPLLNDVVGRRTGSVPEFRYSPAMVEAGKRGMIWTEEALAGFLADPRGFLPATRMPFPGLRNEADRRDVIAYLNAQGRSRPRTRTSPPR